jgi:acyl carrier protein
MTDAEVLEKISELLQADFKVPKEKVTPQATFRGTLGLDSLDAVDLIYLLGKQFNIKPSIEDYKDLHTVGLVVGYVQRKAGTRA